MELIQQLKEHSDFESVDPNKIFYYATPDRGATISRISNDRSSFDASHRKVVEVDPARIDAIRFGYDPNDGDKEVYEARFVHSKHDEDGGWCPVILQDLIGGIDKDLLDRAKENPMQTVELADGAREPTVDDSLACGFAHSSISPCPVVFRADRSGDAVTCVLAAYGNVIAMSINPNQNGLPEIGAKIEGNTKLLCKDAGSLVMRATGVQTAKIKMPIGELYARLMNLGENGKYMGGRGGLFVVSPETHEGSAGHMIGIDANKGLIYDCAEAYALPLTVDNLDRCAGNDALCVGFLRMRELLMPKARGSRGKRKQQRKQAQKQKKARTIDQAGVKAAGEALKPKA
eukprot:SAG25_NODE_406_length_8436_cov_11.691976_2_plen_345_part_00